MKKQKQQLCGSNKRAAVFALFCLLKNWASRRELLSSGWIPRSVRKNTNFRARGRGRGNGGNWNGRGCENGVNKEGGSGGGATYAAFVFTKQQQQSQAVATSFFAGSFSSRNQSSGGWNGGNNGWVGPIETRSLWNNAPIPSTTPFLGGTMSRTSRQNTLAATMFVDAVEQFIVLARLGRPSTGLLGQSPGTNHDRWDSLQCTTLAPSKLSGNMLWLIKFGAFRYMTGQRKYF